MPERAEPGKRLVIELDDKGWPVEPLLCAVCDAYMTYDASDREYTCGERRVRVHAYGPYVIEELGVLP
jgi:hypothetical protein